MSKLGKLSFLFSGLSLLAFGVARFVLGTWVPYLWIFVGLIVLFFAAALFVDRIFFKEIFSMKTTKHGMNTGVMILMFFFLMVVINFLGVRNIATWDFSAAQKNTLSEQSIKLVKNLDSELKVIFFYKKGQEGAEENRAAFRELIKKYQDFTSKINLDFVEVNEHPDMAKEFGVDKGTGIVFLTYKGKKNRIDKIEEQEITSALVKVSRENEKNIYFTMGHKEYNLDESREANGLFQLKGLLEGNNYKVKTWAINSEPKAPADADLVVVAGPTQNFLEFEVKALKEYLKGGGNLLIALEGAPAGLEDFLKSVGIESQQNFIFNIVDLGGQGGVDPRVTFANEFSKEHEITKVFIQNEMTLYQRPMSLAKATTIPAGLTLTELVKTSANSISMKDLKMGGGGPRGPFTLAIAAKGKFPAVAGTSDTEGKEFQLVVFGDADFFNNQFLMQNLNRDLMLNTLAFLSKEENLISITPKEVTRTELSPSSFKQAAFFFGFVIPLPLLMLVTSIGLWFRRRHA